MVWLALTAVALVAADVVQAQWTPNGAPVVTFGANQRAPSIAPDGSDGTLLAWHDGRAGAQGIYAQRLDAAGKPLWATNGVFVGGDFVVNTDIVSDGSGGAIVAFDPAVAGNNIAVQRVSPGGTPQWVAGGVRLDTSTGGSPRMVSDGSGGAIVVWASSGDLYAQRVNPSGIPQWSAGGIVVCNASGSQQNHQVVSDGAGGAIITWMDPRSGSGDIYVQRILGSGSVAPGWSVNGVGLCTAPNSQFSPTLVAAAGDAIVTWQDFRDSTTFNIYARRINSLGFAQGATDGIAICTAPGDQTTPSIASDGPSAVIAWADHRGANWDIYAQGVNSSVVPQWAGNGVSISAFGGDQTFPLAVASGGGAIIAWQDHRGVANDVYAQRVNSVGSVQWQLNGRPLCTAGGDQPAYATIALTSPSPSVAVAAWDDFRGATIDIFAQRAADDFLITASAGPNGTISPSGTVSVSSGANQAFTIDPATNYHVADALVDGMSIGAVTGYSFFGVNNNHAISATFASTVTLSEISPNLGGVDGTVSAVIAGEGIVSGAGAKLTRSGQADIVGNQVVVAANGRSLTASFNLAGKAVGAWNVVVTNPDLSSATLTNGFTIAASTPNQLRVDVVGTPLMRPDRRRAFDLVIENLGSTDMTAVPLWIARIPTVATVDLDFTLTAAPRDNGEPDWTQVPLTLDGPGGKYLALVIPRVPPGVTVRRFYVTVPQATVTTFELDAALTPPWSDGPVFRSCLGDAGVITAPLCMGGQLAAINAYLAATPGIEALSGIGLWAKIGWQCEGAATLQAALGKAEQVLDLMLQPVEQSGIPLGCEGSLMPSWRDSLAVTIVTSVDPNDKLGADGVGANRQIGGGQILPYVIRFENQDNATAPAQIVVVTDVLDASTLNLATVSLGPIKFGRRTNGLPWAVYPPPGLNAYSEMVDLRPQVNLKVQVAVNLDPASGVVGWSLTSLDPTTNHPPTDPLAGFLPPNVNPPEGEGSLLFTVLPLTGLAGGTQIHNQATIDFDGATAQTPEWFNTIDVGVPESQVCGTCSGLPPLGTNQDSVSFTVHWQATSGATDLRDYSVYVSENGGAYRAWRQFTTATADTFTGPGGRTYAFYSLARDLSGNLEAVPGAPDAQTFSRVAVEGPREPRLSLEGAVPNPAVGPAWVWFTLPSRERAVLEVIDVAGRRVLWREVGALGPGRHSVEVGGSLRQPGLYFLRLAQRNQELRARMVVFQ